MINLLKNESISGNAGEWDAVIDGESYKFGCMGARFLYDNKGRIESFLDPIKGALEFYGSPLNKGILRVATGWPFFDKFRLVGLTLNSRTTKEAAENLDGTVEEYNKRYGFGVGD